MTRIPALILAVALSALDALPAHAQLERLPPTSQSSAGPEQQLDQAYERLQEVRRKLERRTPDYEQVKAEARDAITGLRRAMEGVTVTDLTRQSVEQTRQWLDRAEGGLAKAADRTPALMQNVVTALEEVERSVSDYRRTTQRGERQ